MKYLKIFVVCLFLADCIAFALGPHISWTVKKEECLITFTGKKVSGTFKGVKANIIFNEANPAKSKFSAIVDATTFNSATGGLNKEAKGPECLDVDNYPNITFESASVNKIGTGYETTGELTLKGMTKTVTIPFTFEKAETGAAFKGKLTLDPKDYHINRRGAKDKREVPERMDIDIYVPVK
jgi:polyisoprenoid-binding protein YceI